jgi:hypothetical protein
MYVIDPRSALLVFFRYSNEGFVKETLLSLAELLQVTCSLVVLQWNPHSASIHVCPVLRGLWIGLQAGAAPGETALEQATLCAQVWFYFISGVFVIAGPAAIICFDKQVRNGSLTRGVESARFGNVGLTHGLYFTIVAPFTSMLTDTQVHPAISMALLDAVRWHVLGYDKWRNEASCCSLADYVFAEGKATCLLNAHSHYMSCAFFGPLQKQKSYSSTTVCNKFLCREF